jgi:hypothetical protein
LQAHEQAGELRPGSDITCLRGFNNQEAVSAFTLPSSPTLTTQLQERRVIRPPKQLQMHRALEALGWSAAKDEFMLEARLKNQSVPEPIVITENGTILAGFGRWRVALFEGQDQVPCLIYPLTDEEVLPFILAYHRPRQGWNDFVRIRLALTQKSGFQQKALANMRDGGKCKGLTNLLEADRVNVCRQIADLADTGTTNVGKVETILCKAHPNIIAALQNGWLKIHPAWSWCKLSKIGQLDEFARYEEKRTQRKILREFSPRHASASHQLSRVVEAVQRVEARNPGSIIIRTSRSKRTVLVLGEDSLAALEPVEGD